MATVCGVYLLSLDYRLPRGKVASFEYAKSYLLTKNKYHNRNQGILRLVSGFLFSQKEESVIMI